MVIKREWSGVKIHFPLKETKRGKIMSDNQQKGSYYTVQLEIDGRRMPYMVAAHSEFEAARKVRFETGCFVTDRDVTGPYQRY